jgi:hypothetical protein
MTNTGSPIGYIVFIACISLLVWGYALLGQLPVR